MFRVVMFISCLCLLVPELHAQLNADSVAQGVIQVRRPPVKASFTVKIIYDYRTDKKKGRFWESRLRRAQRRYSAWLKDPFPPQPVSVYSQNDTINTKTDSLKRAETKRKNDRPATPFEWEKYLKTVNYTFQWADTIKLDSAVFVYQVDRKGNVEFSPVISAKGSVHQQQLSDAALPAMRRLWLWYPAQRINPKNSRLENVPCKVTVIVYAFDPGREERIPLILNMK
ncbi:MAG: hypothetical protein Fur0041_15790 [Bacteroidia bacterium]